MANDPHLCSIFLTLSKFYKVLRMCFSFTQTHRAYRVSSCTYAVYTVCHANHGQWWVQCLAKGVLKYGRTKDPTPLPLYQLPVQESLHDKGLLQATNTKMLYNWTQFMYTVKINK